MQPGSDTPTAVSACLCSKMTWLSLLEVASYWQHSTVSGILNGATHSTPLGEHAYQCMPHARSKREQEYLGPVVCTVPADTIHFSLWMSFSPRHKIKKGGRVRGKRLKKSSSATRWHGASVVTPRSVCVCYHSASTRDVCCIGLVPPPTRRTKPKSRRCHEGNMANPTTRFNTPNFVFP